ncbi:MAG: hypothetical protein ACLGI7_00340 [Gammaproteobacteria bacterium]
MTRASSVACFALLLCSIAAPSFAQQPDAQGCRGYDGAQWRPLAGDTLMSCLAAVDAAVSAHNAQGFKFGLWGRMLLSADRYYFYSSRDGGKNWQAVGLKSEVTKTTDAVPPPPEVDTNSVLAAVERDSTTSASAGTAAAAQAAETPAAAAGAEAGVAVAAAAEAVVPDSTAERRACSVHVGSNWELVSNMTLEQCARELHSSPDRYDENGFKYAYWSGVFLAADAQEVLKSADSRSGERVLTRASK